MLKAVGTGQRVYQIVSTVIVLLRLGAVRAIWTKSI